MHLQFELTFHGLFYIFLYGCVSCIFVTLQFKYHQLQVELRIKPIQGENAKPA